MTILVVDDSPTMVMSLQDALRQAEFEVVASFNGQEALERLREGLRPALILTDLHMPVLDGIGFIRQARRMAATRFTPILVLTTETGEAFRAEARAAGASGWLNKPIPGAELVAAVRRLTPPTS